jgi:hypothetical protein
MSVDEDGDQTQMGVAAAGSGKVKKVSLVLPAGGDLMKQHKSGKLPEIQQNQLEQSAAAQAAEAAKLATLRTASPLGPEVGIDELNLERIL